MRRHTRLDNPDRAKLYAALEPVIDALERYRRGHIIFMLLMIALFAPATGYFTKFLGGLLFGHNFAADVAGLVLMRTVACLANEAADVMTWTGTRAAHIDTAMRLGTAYPVGPLAWAQALGVARVAGVLGNLQAHYGDPRYRRAPRLTAARFGEGVLA